jgi:tetratricopeptide (TPR) repeat protein
LLRAKTASAAGCLRTMQRKMDQATRWLNESLELFRAAGAEGRHGVAFSLYWFGLGYFFQNRYKDAIPLGEEGLVLYQAIGDRFGVGECLKLIGECKGSIDPHDPQAMRYLEQNLALQEAIGDSDGIATAYYSLAIMAIRTGDPYQAETYIKQSLEKYQLVGNRPLIGETYWALGVIYLENGDYAQAFSHFNTAYSLLKDIDDPAVQTTASFIMREMGRALWAQGNATQALQYFQEALAQGQRLQNKEIIWSSHLLTGIAAASLEDWVKVRQAFKEAYLLSMEKEENCYFIGSFLELLAIEAHIHQQDYRAAQLLGCAHSSHSDVMELLNTPERDLFSRNLEAIRAALGEEAFLQACKEGQMLTYSQVSEEVRK